VSLFQDQDYLTKTHPNSKCHANQTFGEKALDSLEPRQYTAVATKVTVCLALNKYDYEEKVFYLEHQKKVARLEYLSTRQPVLTESWSEQQCRDLNAMMTN